MEKEGPRIGIVGTCQGCEYYRTKKVHALGVYKGYCDHPESPPLFEESVIPRTLETPAFCTYLQKYREDFDKFLKRAIPAEVVSVDTEKIAPGAVPKKGAGKSYHKIKVVLINEGFTSRKYAAEWLVEEAKRISIKIVQLCDGMHCNGMSTFPPQDDYRVSWQIKELSNGSD